LAAGKAPQDSVLTDLWSGGVVRAGDAKLKSWWRKWWVSSLGLLETRKGEVVALATEIGRDLMLPSSFGHGSMQRLRRNIEAEIRVTERSREG